MIALTIALYCIYIIVVFKYIFEILSPNKRIVANYALLIALNSFIVFVPIYITKFQHEIVFMILYGLVLTLELIIIVKRGLSTSIFGVASFAINFFAIRTIVIVVMSIATNQSPQELVSSEDARILITAINLFIPIPYILGTRAVLKAAKINIAQSDNLASKLSAIILAGVFISQIALATGLYIATDNNQADTIYQLLSAVISILYFALVMVMMHYLSNLKDKERSYQDSVSEISRQNSEIMNIEEKSRIDAMTGFLVRDVFEDLLKDCIAKREKSILVFMDIDGLKIVNDKYGHIEGDWYITEVSKKISDIFKGCIISRYGGDEFLVIAKETTLYKIQDALKQLDEQVSQLGAQEDKPYATSISCGAVNVNSYDSFSAQDIIDIADKKMYDHKQAKGMSR